MVSRLGDPSHSKEVAEVRIATFVLHVLRIRRTGDMMGAIFLSRGSHGDGYSDCYTVLYNVFWFWGHRSLLADETHRSFEFCLAENTIIHGSLKRGFAEDTVVFVDVPPLLPSG